MNVLREWKSKSEECERDIQEWNKRVYDVTTIISKHSRQIKSKEALIEQINSRKEEILENSELEQIVLPAIPDAMDTGAFTTGPAFDYSKLSRSLQQNLKSSERDKREAEFTQKIADSISEIERTAPNLKALDQY